MPLPSVPRHEPEVVQASAAKRFFGDHEKVPTTSLPELIVHDVSLSSRYDKADELERMARMVDALPDDLRALIDSICCDSQAGAAYWVNMRECSAGQAKAIGLQLEQICLDRFDGHNGIQFLGRSGGQLLLDPRWSSDEREILGSARG